MTKKLLLLVLLILCLTSIEAQPTEPNCILVDLEFNGDAIDTSGNNIHGVMNGNIQSTTNRLGTANSALLFDGINDFIEFPSDDFNLGTSNYTMSFWFERHGLGNHYLLSKERNFDPYNSRFGTAVLSNPNEIQDTNRLFHKESGYLTSPSWNMTDGFMLQYQTPIQLNTWYHIVAKRDGVNLYLYINGNLVSSFDMQEVIDINNNYNFRVGGRYSPNGTNDASEFFKGKLDDLKIYTCSLTDQEIMNLYENGTTLGVNGVRIEKKTLKIYPSLVSGQFTIENNSNQNLKNIVIYDMLGQIIKTIDLQSHEKHIVNTNGMTSGMYFIKYGKQSYKIIVL